MNNILMGWPYVGLGVALIWFVALTLERRPGAPPRLQDPAWVLPLLWPMYLLHQFEEHGIDLFGRHYAFLADLCGALGHARASPTCPADPAFLFAVNMVGCQMTFALSLLFRRSRPLVAACAWGVALINGMIHIASAIARGAYNPGLLTSVILFLPLSVWMLRTLIRSGVVERRDVPRILVTGGVMHAVLMASLLLRERGWISGEALLVINAVNGLVPLALGMVGAKRPASAFAA